jgi:hypothetical protein
MIWQFKLDNQVVNDPAGWESVEHQLKFDREMRIYRSEFSVDVIFDSDGYDYLLRIDELGICNKVLVNVYKDCDGSGTFVEWFEGYIFIVDIEFDPVECTARAPIQDNSWTTRIAANKSIKAYPNVAFSKNQDAITAATNRNIDFFRPSDGVFPGTYDDIETYLVFDVFTFLVAFMTDNEMTFTSSLFDAGGALEGLCLTTGNAIRDPGNTGYAPFVSFEELFLNMHKLFNLAMYIDLSGAKPDLVIETTDTVRNVPGSPIAFDNLDNMKRTYMTELLYSKVLTGSEETQSDDGGTFAFADVRYLSFKKEEFHLAGECNIDNSLDLVKTYIIDSNVIEDVLINAIEDHDETVFIVETDFDHGGNDHATAFDTFDPGGSPPAPSVYNEGLTTKQSIADYWQPQGLANDLTLLLGDGNDGFEAKLSADIGLTVSLVRNPAATGLELATVVSDPNANYNNVTYYYDAPSDGFYRFALDIEMDNFVYVPVTSESYDIEFTIERMDNLNVFIEDRTYTNNGFSGTSISDSFQPAGFYADAGDRFYVGCNIISTGIGPFGSADVDAATTFRTLQTETGGGTYATFDIEEYRVKRWQFKTVLSQNDWETIQAAPNDAITINLGSTPADDETVFIEELKYIPETGEAEFTVINSNN